jgi:flagellar biosynthetic protein FlhB
MLLGVVAPHFMSGWLESLGGFLGYGKAAYWEQNTVDGTLRSLMGLAMETLSPVALLMAAVVAAALGTGIVQTGGIKIHPQVLGLKLERANPLANLRNLFSLRSTARLGKSMVPASFLTIFAVQRVAHQWDIPPFATVRLISLGRDVYELLLAAAWLLFCWALIDYFVEWRSREKRLKMSRQEMREEYKDSEGNPQIRGRIKNLQRQARRRRVKADVSRAAVIVTNPTHYAVALDFNFETMEAPRVLAKGRNLLAEEIKDEARWAGIPIMENPPLTRSLYSCMQLSHRYLLFSIVSGWKARCVSNDRTPMPRNVLNRILQRQELQSVLPDQSLDVDLGAALKHRVDPQLYLIGRRNEHSCRCQRADERYGRLVVEAPRTPASGRSDQRDLCHVGTFTCCDS